MEPLAFLRLKNRRCFLALAAFTLGLCRFFGRPIPRWLRHVAVASTYTNGSNAPSHSSTTRDRDRSPGCAAEHRHQLAPLAPRKPARFGCHSLAGEQTADH